MRRTGFAIIAVALALFASSSAAHAQATGISMDIDPSIRASGMGGSSTAVLWGPGTNFWANPAVTASESGFRYEYGHTQLLPQLASDLSFTSSVLKLGGYGIGTVIAGEPFGGMELNYGASLATDENGNPIGTFSSFERVKTWGVGVSVLQVIEALSGDLSRPVSRYIDFSAGMNLKHLEMNIAPMAGHAEADNRDWGIAARITPVIHQTEDVNVQLDASFGLSELSADDKPIMFPFQDIATPVSRHQKRGIATRFQVGPSLHPWKDSPWRRAFAPWVQLSAAADWTTVSAGGSPYSYDTKGMGAEVGFANVLWLRAGHYEDLGGDIDGTTWGWGIALPAGDFGGVRYDGARFPVSRSSGLDDHIRHGVQVWLDPWAIARGMKPRSI